MKSKHLIVLLDSLQFSPLQHQGLLLGTQRALQVLPFTLLFNLDLDQHCSVSLFNSK
jgi:hypothetical protein